MFVRLMLCDTNLAPDNERPVVYVNGAQVAYLVPGAMYRPNPDFVDKATEVHLMTGDVLLVRPDNYNENELAILFGAPTNYPCGFCRGSGANADRTGMCDACKGSGDAELCGEWPTLRH